MPQLFIRFPARINSGMASMVKLCDVEMDFCTNTVIGRSLIIGRPVAMMLMHENATVVNCHTRTVDVPSITREADILIAAAGVLRSVKPEFTNPDQVVIDVGINWDEEAGSIAGDVDFEAVEPVVKAITPVPAGVGSVTTSVLMKHVVEAAIIVAESL